MRYEAERCLGGREKMKERRWKKEKTRWPGKDQDWKSPEKEGQDWLVG